MATQILNLPILGGIMPTSNPCVVEFVLDRAKLLFDDTTNEWILFQFRMPANYVGSPVVKGQFSMASAVADNVEFGAALMAVTPEDARIVSILKTPSSLLSPAPLAI